jgi:hypothetical protein
MGMLEGLSAGRQARVRPVFPPSPDPDIATSWLPTYFLRIAPLIPIREI